LSQEEMLLMYQEFLMIAARSFVDDHLWFERDFPEMPLAFQEWSVNQFKYVGLLGLNEWQN